MSVYIPFYLCTGFDQAGDLKRKLADRKIKSFYYQRDHQTLLWPSKMPVVLYIHRSQLENAKMVLTQNDLIWRDLSKVNLNRNPEEVEFLNSKGIPKYQITILRLFLILLFLIAIGSVIIRYT